MSDSEDDYMSSKILNQCQEPERSSLLFNREKRKHEQYKKKIESMNKRQKSVKELEQENRNKGLNTAISQENKGFKLLKKMGFKPGDSLGKTKESGITVPLDIVLKQGTSGIGRESFVKQKISTKREVKLKNLKHCENQFLSANRQRTVMAQLRRDFFKAQQICEELDFRKNVLDPVDNFFWTKATIQKRRKSVKDTSDGSDDGSDDDDDQFEQNINDENLYTIIDYLRSRHLYCLYCVITGSDEEDLKENCPGPYRRDHENEIE